MEQNSGNVVILLAIIVACTEWAISQLTLETFEGKLFLSFCCVLFH